MYSFRTALIISMGKRRLDSYLRESFICVTVTHLSIASCETEQKFGFLLRVIEAGPLCGSTLGVGGTGGAGGATLGGFVWGRHPWRCFRDIKIGERLVKSVFWGLHRHGW